VATKPSKFSSIFQNDEEPKELLVEDVTVQAMAPVMEQTPVLEPLPGIPEEGSAPNRRIGRPATGKKSDPNYRQVTAYVRKDLYRDVTDALYDEVRGQDAKRKEFSELVDELLEQWWQVRSPTNDST